jgi:Calcineurin-like phosphoesterase
MRDSSAENDRPGVGRQGRTPILDPRRGDLENDHSATKQRSLLSIFGSLITEISLPKLLFAWTVSILLPAVLLGLAPLVLSAWVGKSWTRLVDATGMGIVLAVVVSLLVAWFGWRPLFRVAEKNFWSLNALAVQPGYAFWREAMRHLIERSLKGRTGAELARIRAGSSAAAGLLVFVVATAVALAAWPFTHWAGSVSDLVAPHLLIIWTIANVILVMSAYLAVAALVWGFAEAAGDQPLDLEAFDVPTDATRIWRIAHLSDVHVVGERYGFRVESGRAGPRGNDRLVRAMERLAALHATEPLDLVLVSGDMTDAGLSAEWAEFFDIVAAYPVLAERMLILPGNHDVNIVDRANPARLDLAVESGQDATQDARALGDRGDWGRSGPCVRSCGRDARTCSRRSARTAARGDERLRGCGRNASLRPTGAALERFLPPDPAAGGGSRPRSRAPRLQRRRQLLVHQCPRHDLRRTGAAAHHKPRRLSRARWIIALHHHLAEYPAPVKALSERIGTALINGAWFLRVLRPYAARLVVMHGHRHIDWIGRCGELKLISAPSPVMGCPDEATHFHVHSLAAAPDGSIRLFAPQRIDLDPVTSYRLRRSGVRPPKRSAIHRVRG